MSDPGRGLPHPFLQLFPKPHSFAAVNSHPAFHIFLSALSPPSIFHVLSNVFLSYENVGCMGAGRGEGGTVFCSGLCVSSAQSWLDTLHMLSKGLSNEGADWHPMGARGSTA